MVVFLPFGFAFQGWTDGVSSRQQCWINHICCRSRTAVAGVHQLDRSTRRRRQADHGQLEQPVSLMHLGLFEAHAIAFQGAEQLFDPPSQAIQPDDFARRRGVANRDRGQ